MAEDHADLSLVPDWTIEWYKQNNLCDDLIYEFINKSKTNKYSDAELLTANTLIDMNKIDNISNNKIKKRCAPKAHKCCKKCNNIVVVNSAKQKCTIDGCCGLLCLQTKPCKEIKRRAPKCKKQCSKCLSIFENIATALQKCNNCGEKIYIVK